MSERIAVVDDEPIILDRLKRCLETPSRSVSVYPAAEPFLKEHQDNPFHLVLLDIRLPDMDGLAVLSRIKAVSEETEVVMMTGYASIETAVEAMKQGAYHFIAKPFSLKQIRSIADSVLEKVVLRAENRSLREAMEDKESIEQIVGSGKAMQEIFELIRKVAAVDCNVLIQGPSGTGKELVARAIRALSPRRLAPFVSFNCGGFTAELINSELFGYEKGAFTGANSVKIGLLESANGGTVFLDEIGEMPLSMQVKLLQVIQEKWFYRVGGIKPIDLDIRILAATNRDLKREVELGNFREDLFFRLNVVMIRMPTLLERKDDIPLLVNHFIQRYNRAFGKSVQGISREAMNMLLSYNFPGNVRELKNIIERAVALSDGSLLQPADLPVDLQQLEFNKLPDGDEMPNLDEVTRNYILSVFQKTHRNRNLTARILGIPRTTLWRRLKEYGVAGEREDA
jgi:DNA-binding NtrC family response regulator